MKLTHQAAARASTLVRKQQEGAFDNAFTKYPELHQPAFWEKVMVRVADPALAQDVLDLLDRVATEGVTHSPYIAKHLEDAMKAARKTLRNEEIKRWNRQKR